MSKNAILCDLTSLVCETAGVDRLSNMTAETRLDHLDCDNHQILTSLGMDVSASELQGATTLGEVASILADQPKAVLAELKDAATRARIKRLIGVTLATAPGSQSVVDVSTWWYELVTQILWWYASEKCINGRNLVEDSIPTRAAKVLIDLGVVEVNCLADASAEEIMIFESTLKRFGFDQATVQDVHACLSSIAKHLVSNYDAKIQKALRLHSDNLAEAFSKEFITSPQDRKILQNALYSWISIMTRLPISVWSPGTVEFKEKFADFGVSEQTLSHIAEDDQIDFRTVDQGICLFMDTTCRFCDPNSPDQRFCVNKFAAMAVEVECPATATH